MKEIDFIPEWYKAGRSRKRRYVHQCTWMGVLFMVMVTWSFIMGRHVEYVRAEVDSIQGVLEQGQVRVEQSLELERQVADIKEKLQMLSSVAPRTPVSALIGEVSYLAGGNVILNRLLFENEPLPENRPQGTMPSTAVVQTAGSEKKDKASSMPNAVSRMKVVMTGIAAMPSDAAALISALEQTDYFEQVAPVFTRAKKVKDLNVTEFEIRCYVADYRIEK